MLEAVLGRLRVVPCLGVVDTGQVHVYEERGVWVGSHPRGGREVGFGVGPEDRRCVGEDFL